MKRVRFDTWVCQLQPPRNPRLSPIHPAQQPSPVRNHCTSTRSQSASTQPRWCHRRNQIDGRRQASTAAAVKKDGNVTGAEPATKARPSKAKTIQPQKPPKPLKIDGNARIAKLSALHARLALPARLPLHTLARCLIDPSADSHPARNNASMAVLGRDLLAYYTTEHLMVNYPRLPLPILYAAQYAYSGPAVLSAMRSEWGVELAAAPGTEVDRALLQFRRRVAGNALSADGVTQNKRLTEKSGRDHPSERKYRGWASRVVYDDEFGEVKLDAIDKKPYPGARISESGSGSEGATPSPDAEAKTPVVPEESVKALSSGVTAEEAGAAFIRALAGALYLHAGDEAVKNFHAEHILSRHLQLHKLFHFNAAPRDLNRLCEREGFESPVARLLSETGRQSRTPVFVVGVYSGQDKLGEAAGASLNEARVRAAAAALRAWYLYSPPIDNVMRPSDVLNTSADTKKRAFIPQMIDIGEIIS